MVPGAGGQSTVPPSSHAQEYELLIDGAHIVDVAGLPPDQTTARAPPDVGDRWETLVGLVSDESGPALMQDIRGLLFNGTDFNSYMTGAGAARFRVEGRTSGLQATVRVRSLSAAEVVLLGELETARAELASRNSTAAALAKLPVALMQCDADNMVLWQTEKAREMSLALADPHSLQVPVDHPRLAALRDREEGRHLTVTEAPVGDTDHRLFLVEDKSDVVAARASLTSLMATMTETFAHLGTALAVFDHRLSLSLFNPSLSELFGLDPAALAGRPTLRDFLEALRRARRLPEQADFARWRDDFIATAVCPDPAPLEQRWHLPGGEILRVTARPHAGGAVVLLFEDISDHVSLERRYRVEIETGQSILDRLGEGIAVFSSSGQVVYCNPAFAEAMGFDPFRDLVSGGLRVLIDHATSVFGHSEHWQSFREYAVSAERRKDWTRRFDTPNGGTMWLRANPLPDGSTMLVAASGPIESAGAIPEKKDLSPDLETGTPDARSRISRLGS